MTQQNPLMNRFQNQAPVAPPAGAPAPAYVPPPPQAPSAYDSTDTGKERFPRPQPGTYRFRVIQSGEQQMVDQRSGFRGDPYFFVDFEVVQVISGGSPFRAEDAATGVGTIVHYDQCVSNGAQAAAGPRINRLFLALLEPVCGAKTPEELQARMPGIKRAAAGYAVNGPDGQPYPPNPLVGLEVIGTVSLGNVCMVKDQSPGAPRGARVPDPKGDRYRDYSWSPVTA